MTTIFTMGFTQKKARQFFDLIQSNGIELMIDIRLNNISQLAGFTKGDDLEYFLDVICGCRYEYRPDFAPTKEIMEGYKGGTLGWEAYESQYSSLIKERNATRDFAERYGGYEKICLMCSEAKADHCHRRILAGMISGEFPQYLVNNI
ncbi:MAG: DUF488 domain-containing protein [Synergistaceae bacterium]|nr:DUF488 domain-containing protein [Synergistaceae bacterium]